jgi:hypothetical protein
LILILALLLLGAIQATAQEAQSAAQTAENLRAQLRDVQMKEAELQYRLNELDYELKPENIERYFAGVGSTRPEELREHRRRQLQLEKDTLTNQLQSLASSRQRLEVAITNADARTYQQSALGATNMLVAREWHDHRGPIVTGAVALFACAGFLGVLIVARRRRRRR